MSLNVFYCPNFCINFLFCVSKSPNHFLAHLINCSLNLYGMGEWYRVKRKITCFHYSEFLLMNFLLSNIPLVSLTNSISIKIGLKRELWQEISRPTIFDLQNDNIVSDNFSNIFGIQGKSFLTCIFLCTKCLFMQVPGQEPYMFVV